VHEERKIKQVGDFGKLIFVCDFLIFIFGIFLLHQVGFYLLSLIFYVSVLALIESLKLVQMSGSLKGKMSFFINNNTDQIHEPFFF
jgi:hypothetical protein